MLRAAGDRAFCAGLDVNKPFGQPDDIWNHEDPGEMLSPKWQKVWKPVVCAVQGMCTAGAFYFVNESDVVICSPEATFFDSHVSAGMVSAIEPIGLMRRTGLGNTLRMALMGNDERVGAETALRIGLVTEVVERATLWDRAHEIAATIAAKPSIATQGTVRAIWESLDRPYRAAMEQGLIYTRLANPAGMAEAAAQPAATARTGRSGSGRPDLDRALGADRRRRRDRPDALRPSSSRAAGRRGATSARPIEDIAALVGAPGAKVGIVLRNRPAHVGCLLGVLRGGGCVVTINPQRGVERTRDDIARLELSTHRRDERRSGRARRP